MSYDTLLHVCIGGSAGCLMIVLWQVVAAWPTLGWGHTEGVVEKAFLVEVESDDITVYSTRTKLYVTYTYTVRGKVCRCSRVSWSEPLFWTKRSLEAELARYSKGTKVRVYYSRFHPDANAVLRRTTIGWFTRSCAMAAIGFFMTGIIVSNAALRESVQLCVSDVTQCRAALAPLLE